MSDEPQPASDGRIVHFRIGEGRCIPAIVVKTWSPETVNLQVFLDGTNDRQYATSEDAARRGVDWRTSVKREDAGQELTETTSSWHWPERV